MRYLLFFFCCALPLRSAQGLIADADSDCKQLQSLAPNTRVQVHLRSGEVVKGTVQGCDATSLTVAKRRGQAAQFAKADVLRVTKKSRLRGAMWGGIVGFGVAAPVFAYLGPYIGDIGQPNTSDRLEAAFGAGAIFGGIGAGIGAATGTQVTVYRPQRPALR
jgi:hypothetical protein